MNKSQEKFYKRLKKITRPAMIVCGDRTRVLYPNGLCVWRSNYALIENTYQHHIESEYHIIFKPSCFINFYTPDANILSKKLYEKRIARTSLADTVTKMKDYDTYQRIKITAIVKT